MSEKNNLVDASKIEVLQIKTLKGNINASENSDPGQVASYGFDVSLGTGLSVENKMIGLKLIIDISSYNDKEEPLDINGSYTHEIIFRVENLEDLVEKKGKGGMINAALGATLISIAYSTVRGIIFTRTQGTSLGSVILPVINPAMLMEDNIKISPLAAKTE